MHYTGQVYRHPVEASTPLLEVTAGCSHNKCSFCTMYRETPFALSSLAVVEEDLQELAASRRKITRVFLVNGEPFVLPSEKLEEIGRLMRKYLPDLETITCYASIKGLKKKSLEELKNLRKLGFNQLHVGLETAYDPALKQMNKAFNQAEAYENIEKLVNAGIEWDALLMLGVAGQGNSQIHIEQTAKLLNQYPPYMVSIMTTSVSTGTELEIMRDAGEFVECTEGEKILEEIDLLQKLNFSDAYFFGGHSYNLVPINGKLTEKNKMIQRLQEKYQEYGSKLDAVFPRANI